MTLQESKKEQIYIVDDVTLEDKLMVRLQALGMITGTQVEILNQKSNGSMMIKVRGTRFAIGKQIAAGVKVHEMEKKKNG